jgi:hypothetical protein
MFDDPRDVNRGLGNRDPYQYGNMPSEGSGYALPIALLAIVVIIGGLIAFAPSTNQQTASSDPAVTRSAPAPAPAPIAPPKTTAPSQ